MVSDVYAALPYRPCVGVVLARPDGQIFAAERIDTPGAWQMPQGGIDPGETPTAAALRELQEETGLAPERVEIVAETADWLSYDLPEHLLGKVWKGRFRGQKQKWVLLRFRGEDSDIDIATPHQEFSRWAWMPPEAVLKAIVPFKRAIYETVLERFGPQLAESGPS